MSEVERLRARLLEQVDSGLRTIGGGSVTSDGKCEMWGNQPIMAARNPDGTAAVAHIDAVSAERDAAVKRAEEAEAFSEYLRSMMTTGTWHIIASEQAFKARATAAEAEVARLREVLEPWRGAYAIAIEPFEGKWPDDFGVAPLLPTAWPTIADLRAIARAEGTSNE